MMLTRPDDRTKAALQRLRFDADFVFIVEWLGHSLAELDQTKRLTIDSVLLRQQQGAAQTLAELVEYARNQRVQAHTPIPMMAGARRTNTSR